ncbi:hypothetical protein HanLR1_Chr02g0073261 [Helianthus annuus]|nr:hypothetical protein HanLR1_Chr02g0073261 [Helianthus annuus]
MKLLISLFGCILLLAYKIFISFFNELTDGFVSAEVLASTVEKSWLSLHVQETTATFLTAALASRQSEQIPSQPRETGSSSTSPVTTNASASVDNKVLDDDKAKSENRAPPVEGEDPERTTRYLRT